MPTSYRVHRFAQLAGVTVKALRHYELDVDTWQRVTDFIERAATIDGNHAGGADRPRSLA